MKGLSLSTLRRAFAFLTVVALASVFQNCDNVKLSLATKPVVEKSIGMLCAQQPALIEDEHRFIFMIDNSGSMQGVDPGSAASPSRRVTALRNFIDYYKTSDKFSITVGSLYDATAGFLPDPTNPVAPNMPQGQPNCQFFKPMVAAEYATLQTALNQLDTQASPSFGTTPFMSLLNSYQNCLAMDLPNNQGAVYSLVFVTDGAPTDTALADLEAKLAPIIAMGKLNGATVSNINLYMLYLDPTDTSQDAANVVSGLIKTAQDAGGVKSKAIMLDPTQPLDYTVLNLTNAPHYRLSQLLVTNLNAGIEDDGTLGTDSDSDGITDLREANLGLDPKKYSTHDMCSDLVYLRSGGKCPSTCPQGLRYLDSDHDGLSDCDETIIGTNSSDMDTDGDGIPDGLEYILGLSPTDAADRNQDPDGDGILNFQEAARFTSPFIDDRPVHHDTLVNVSTQEFQQADGTYCYNVNIDGIPVFPTQAVTQNTLSYLNHGANQNIVRILFLEVPENQPSAKPVPLEAYRVFTYSAGANANSTIDDLSTNDFSFINQ
jgi:Bacterial TSP3 repeat